MFILNRVNLFINENPYFEEDDSDESLSDEDEEEGAGLLSS